VPEPTTLPRAPAVNDTLSLFLEFQIKNCLVGLVLPVRKVDPSHHMSAASALIISHLPHAATSFVSCPPFPASHYPFFPFFFLSSSNSTAYSFSYYYLYLSSVGIATGYGLGDRGLIPSRSKRFFSTPQHPDPVSYPMGAGGLHPWDKWPEREAVHFPPPSTGVKNGGAVTPLPDTTSWHGA
jgi:hypothetical protein